MRDVPRRRTGRGQASYPEISLSNVFFGQSVEFDIKRFSRLSILINTLDLGTLHRSHKRFIEGVHRHIISVILSSGSGKGLIVA